MGSKAKTTVALKKEILETVDQESRRRHQTRSAVIEEALRLWQRLRLERELAEGYQAMADEDRKTAEKSLHAAREILR